MTVFCDSENSLVFGGSYQYVRTFIRIVSLLVLVLGKGGEGAQAQTSCLKEFIDVLLVQIPVEDRGLNVPWPSHLKGDHG
jgi:hypothetical protein